MCQLIDRILCRRGDVVVRCCRTTFEKFANTTPRSVRIVAIMKATQASGAGEFHESFKMCIEIKVRFELVI